MNEHPLQLAMLDLATAAVQFAANWFLQSAVLITIGLAMGRLLARHGSAAQSAIYRTTLVAVLICPIASWLLSLTGVSGWSVPVPRAWTEATAVVALVADRNSQVARDAKITTAVMMEHYVDETDEELRDASNRTFRRLVAGLGPAVAERYGHRPDLVASELENQMQAALARKDWAAAQLLAISLGTLKS